MNKLLPFEPLRAYLRISRELDFTRDAGLTSLGWVKGTWQAKAWEAGRKRGGFTVATADRLACDLRTHPSSIWGEAWWDPGKPDATHVLLVPKLVRLERALHSAHVKERKAARIPRVSADQLVGEFNAAFPESPLVKSQRLHDLMLEEGAWVAEQPEGFRALGGTARYGAPGRLGIPTQRPAPDRRQAVAS